MTAAKILKGNWSARWGNWVVGLRSCGTTWAATVWRWLPGRSLAGRHELAVRDGFKTVGEAVAWACEEMRTDGAVVMVLDAPLLTLEGMLSFSPSPWLAA